MPAEAIIQTICLITGNPTTFDSSLYTILYRVPINFSAIITITPTPLFCLITLFPSLTIVSSR